MEFEAPLLQGALGTWYWTAKSAMFYSLPELEVLESVCGAGCSNRSSEDWEDEVKEERIKQWA